MQTRTKATPEEIAAYVRAIKAVADCIRDLGRVPSGHLYALLMPLMSLATYQRIIENLRAAEIVEQTPAFELVWKGRAR
jgi:hypothetical protein